MNSYHTLPSPHHTPITLADYEKILDNPEMDVYYEEISDHVINRQSHQSTINVDAVNRIGELILTLFKDQFISATTVIVESPRGFREFKARNNVGDSLFYSSDDCGWIERYSHLLSVVSDLPEDEDTKFLLDFRKLLDIAGVTQIHLYDNEDKTLSVVCQQIGTHLMDEQNRRHNDNGPASVWSDGYYEYRYEDVYIDPKYIEHPITPETWAGIEDVDVRAAIIGYLGNDKLIEALALEMVDHDTSRDLTLYETKSIDPNVGQKLTFIRMVCPSSHRVYVLPCKPVDGNAWKTMQVMWPMPEGVNYDPEVEA